MLLVQHGIKFLIGWYIRFYAEIIYLHVSNRSEIPLMSISKSFVDIDTFVSFLKSGGGGFNYSIHSYWEYSGFKFINDNSMKEKMEKMNRWK